jgi:hypothetical protein
MLDNVTVAISNGLKAEVQLGLFKVISRKVSLSHLIDPSSKLKLLAILFFRVK